MQDVHPAPFNRQGFAELVDHAYVLTSHYLKEVLMESDFRKEVATDYDGIIGELAVCDTRLHAGITPNDFQDSDLSGPFAAFATAYDSLMMAVAKKVAEFAAIAGDRLLPVETFKVDKVALGVAVSPYLRSMKEASVAITHLSHKVDAKS